MWTRLSPGSMPFTVYLKRYTDLFGSQEFHTIRDVYLNQIAVIRNRDRHRRSGANGTIETRTNDIGADEYYSVRLERIDGGFAVAGIDSSSSHGRKRHTTLRIRTKLFLLPRGPLIDRNEALCPSL